MKIHAQASQQTTSLATSVAAPVVSSRQISLSSKDIPSEWRPASIYSPAVARVNALMDRYPRQTTALIATCAILATAAGGKLGAINCGLSVVFFLQSDRNNDRLTFKVRSLIALMGLNLLGATASCLVLGAPDSPIDLVKDLVAVECTIALCGALLMRWFDGRRSSIEEESVHCKKYMPKLDDREERGELLDLVRCDAKYQKAFGLLDEKLAAAPAQWTFFRYATAFDIRDDLIDLPVFEVNDGRDHGFIKYDGLKQSMTVSARCPPVVIVHELLHVLHFRALARAMDYPTLQGVYRSELLKQLAAEFQDIAEFYGLIGNYLATQASDVALTPEIRGAAAYLLFSQMNPQYREAIASAFDRALEADAGLRRVYALRHFIQPVASLILWLGGRLDREIEWGYRNAPLLRRIQRAGLYRSAGLSDR